MAAEESATGSASKSTAKEEPAAAAAQGGEQQAAAQEASNDVPREEIWRLRAKRFRDQVQDIQTRLTNFTRQPENPDPARQRKLVKDIADLRLAIGTLQNQWNDFEKSAREAKIDLSWISPPPQFQQ